MNEAPARLGNDTESVHQMRVATRRLRAALRVFEDVFPTDVEAFRRELAWLAGELGSVRDLDVQLSAIRGAAEAIEASAEALSEVFQWFELHRSAAHCQLVESLESPRYAALVGSLTTLTSTDIAEWPSAAHVQSSESAPERLQARYRRFRKVTRLIGPASAAEDLHRARIQTKKLRYALEFMAALYGKQARTLIKRAVALQDVLGGIQDATVIDDRLRSISFRGCDLPPASVFMAGQLAQHFAQRAEALREKVPRASRRLRRTRWRRLVVSL